MKFSYSKHLPSWWRRGCVLLLALFWCIGLLCGCAASRQAEAYLVPLMSAAAAHRVSIVGLLAVLLLPLLFSAFAVFISEPRLLLAAAFLKAFTFGFTAWGITVAFGMAGWLIRSLLLFSDCCMLPFLFWFWLRHISGERAAVRNDLAVCTAVAVLVGSIDFWKVSPFLALLIET